MLFKADTLERVARGEITAALRRWSKPTVKAGGTLVTRVGVLAIDAVDVVDAVALDDAVAAGFGSVDDAMAALDRKGRPVGWGPPRAGAAPRRRPARADRARAVPPRRRRSSHRGARVDPRGPFRDHRAGRPHRARPRDVRADRGQPRPPRA